ncbi:MAG: arylesterase [Gemmatimonadetes bacterium]|nr:arylesterase [Gemmatimonadota bacterium]
MLIPLLIWLLPFATADILQDGAGDGPHRTVLFYGNSLTTGFGIDPDKAYPQLIQEKIDGLGWSVRVINGGVGGETSAGGLSRIDWVLQNRVDVFVLELGGNDGLRGVDPRTTRRNLRAIIRRVRDRYPEAKIILAGMQAPPNMGQRFVTEFREMYPALAESERVSLIPFILEGVGGIPELNLPDGIHPTAEGHAIMAENVWKVLKPVLEDLRP